MKSAPFIFLSLLLTIAGCSKKEASEEGGSGTSSGSQETASASEQATATDFTLLDQNGRARLLSREGTNQAVVIVAHLRGDPSSRSAVEALKPLHQRFSSQGITFWLLNSEAAATRENLTEEAKLLGIDLPILKDPAQLVTWGLGLRRGGEVVVVQPKDFSILYRGAINEELSEPLKKGKPSGFLLESLEKITSGSLARQKPVPSNGTELPLALIDRPISYEAEVAPLLEKNCVHCHSKGNIGPFAMTSHQKVSGMSAMIREVLLTQRMPPWHADPHHGDFVNARQLKPQDALLLISWIDQGCPKGEGADPLSKVAAQQTSDWPLGAPDLVVKFPKPEEIPATGVLPYRNILIPNPVPTNSWVRAAVIRPGNKKVVHHAVVVALSPQEISGGRLRPGNSVIDGYFTAFVPGIEPVPFPDGTGKLLPKGSILYFQMHYTTTGKEETDETELALYFHQQKPETELLTRSAFTNRLRIPPGAPEHISQAEFRFSRDSLLYELSPHMHLRGSWFVYEALYPDKTSEVILSVPRYDFKWQHLYRLAEPKKMPAGTRLICRGAHDNSPNNPDNPDPNKEVHFGDQTFDEMFIGYINYVEVKGGFKKTTASLPSENYAAK